MPSQSLTLGLTLALLRSSFKVHVYCRVVTIVNIFRLLSFLVLLALLANGVTQNPAGRNYSDPPRAQTVRVMTYNIHVGVGMDKKLDLPRIAGVINAQHPDLVGLQEVDRGVTRTQQIDEIAELAKLTKMDYAF